MAACLCEEHPTLVVAFCEKSNIDDHVHKNVKVTALSTKTHLGHTLVTGNYRVLMHSGKATISYKNPRNESVWNLLSLVLSIHFLGLYV